MPDRPDPISDRGKHAHGTVVNGLRRRHWEAWHCQYARSVASEQVMAYKFNSE